MGSLASGPRPRRTSLLRLSGVALVLACLASVASADTPPPFSEVRHANAAVDDALAAMPSGDLVAAFNRLSALLHRGDVESLPAGAAATGGLPRHFERSMDSALADLRRRLESGLWELDPPQQFVVLQLVAAYGFERNLELYQGVAWEDCSAAPPGACDNPAVIQRLDELALLMRPVLNEVAAWYEDTGATPPYAGPAGDGANSQNFRERIEELGVFLYPTGVEEIQY